MGWNWQDFATLWLVLGASVYLVRRFVPGLSRKPSSGCGHCPSKNGSSPCHQEPAVVSITMPQRPREKTGSERE